MVIAQEPTQSLVAPNRPLAAAMRIPRKQQEVALPLMIPLGMEMVEVFAQCRAAAPAPDRGAAQHHRSFERCKSCVCCVNRINHGSHPLLPETPRSVALA